jgi:hypothetical protein
MHFMDKFRKKNQDEPPRRRAPRRGSTAGLLQPEDGIAADSKARRYDKRAAPHMSDILTNSLSTCLVTEGMTMSLPGVTTKRASDGGATLAPPKRLLSLTPGMFRGTGARVGLETQPDTQWSTIEDDLGASDNFSIGSGDFQENENEMKEAGASFKIPETTTTTTTESTQAQEASFAPQFDTQFDTQSTGFDSSLGPDTFAHFDSAAPLESTTAKGPSPIVFESSQEGAFFADFDSSAAANIPGARKATEKQVTAAEIEASQQQSETLVDLESSATGPGFASHEHLGAQLFSYSPGEGPESFVQFDPNSSEPQVFSVTDS